EPNDISLFPSPVPDQLHLNTGGRVVRSLELITVEGHRVSVALEGSTIDVDQLAPGAYALRLLFTDGTVHMRRFEVVR
ncbi:MAG TPA: hypothetical protein VKG92_00500, partial [Flavobacteriales bacterium]|nr:hypothetical protein [Flavobacteriales bacterium]